MNSRAALPLPWVEKIFSVMSASYGTLFADRWRGMNLGEVKAAWASKLADLTPAELKRGLNSLGGFPPTLPEFALLCRPKPNPESAHAEACRLIGRLDGWSDCSVFWAAREIGYHDLKAMPYRDIRGRWIDALERAWLDRKPIPEAKPVAGRIAPDAGPKPQPMTEKQRQEMWERINAVGAKFARKPAPGYKPPDADDLAALKAAEAEILAREKA
jgi:hypothetical protein